MNKNEIARRNSYEANFCEDHGDDEALGSYLFPSGRLGNFIISGGASPDRLPLLDSTFRDTVGALPVIVFHNRTPGIEQHFMAALSNAAQSGHRTPYAIVNDHSKLFEPFFGMSEAKVTSCLRQMAQKLGYQANALFEQTARAHYQILRLMGAPLCLSGLYYLSTFTDMRAFFNNIMALPCPRSEAEQIWAKLGASDSPSSEQFELFRSVIQNFAEEALQSGWSTDNSHATVNCMSAIENDACLSLPLDNLHNKLMSIYLAEELSLLRKPCFLLFCDTLLGPELVEYLRSSSGRIYFGFSSDHAADMFPDQPEAFSVISAAMSSLILLRHNSALAAEKYSQIIGNYNEAVLDVSRGSSKQLFKLFPQGKSDNQTLRTQNVYKVKPEDITDIPNGAAIIYLPACEGQIIFFNM